MMPLYNVRPLTVEARQYYRDAPNAVDIADWCQAEITTRGLLIFDAREKDFMLVEDSDYVVKCDGEFFTYSSFEFNATFVERSVSAFTADAYLETYSNDD